MKSLSVMFLVYILTPVEIFSSESLKGDDCWKKWTILSPTCGPWAWIHALLGAWYSRIKSAQKLGLKKNYWVNRFFRCMVQSWKAAKSNLSPCCCLPSTQMSFPGTRAVTRFLWFFQRVCVCIYVYYICMCIYTYMWYTTVYTAHILYTT